MIFICNKKKSCLYMNFLSRKIVENTQKNILEFMEIFAKNGVKGKMIIFHCFRVFVALKAKKEL